MDIDFGMLREALSKLDEGQKPSWGTMTATRMLTHCNAFINVSIGVQKVSRSSRWMGWLIGGLYLRYLARIHYDITKLQKNSKTLKNFINSSNSIDFDAEMSELLENLAKIELLNSDTIHHQLYGSMDRKKFQKLMFFHTAYHLYQFDLINPDYPRMD